jgi:hypothetical protein
VGPDSFLVLQAGEDGRFKAAWLILTVTAYLLLLAANTSWGWKLAALVSLSLTFAVTRWQARRANDIRLVRLYSNGTVTLVLESNIEIPGVLAGQAWISPWISVLPVGRFDRWKRQRLLICHSRNHPADYRRMLKILRLGTASTAGDGILGPR